MKRGRIMAEKESDREREWKNVDALSSSSVI